MPRSADASSTGVYLQRLTTGKGILGWSSWIVCNLYTSSLTHGVVIEVDIGALVEAVVRGLLGRRGEVVMDVCEAAALSVHDETPSDHYRLQCRQRHLALLWRHCGGE